MRHRMEPKSDRAPEINLAAATYNVAAGAMPSPEGLKESFRSSSGHTIVIGVSEDANETFSRQSSF